ncbi:MAG: hypothetical protein DWQ09_07070 [Proteobacteria bacterium]|nr:MAG: hypothetical protein DWQ09_07070 [Pseudomonadota bacterium]
MSLVNQMLKDLETRRAPEMGGEAVLRDLSTGRPHTAGARSRMPALVAGGLVATLSLAAAGYWFAQKSITPVQITQPPSLHSALPAAVIAGEREARPEAVDAVTPNPLVETAIFPLKQATTGSEAVEKTEAESVTPAQTTAPPAPMAATMPAVEEAPPAPMPTKPAREVIATAKAPPAPRSAPLMERVTRPQSSREKAQSAYLKGADLVRLNRLGEAETSLRSALALDPDLIEAREILAAVLLRSQRSDEAERVLWLGLERNKGAYSLARIYARILVERNEVDAAIQVLEASLPAPALDPEFYGLLAALYQRVAEHAKAAEAYRRVLAITPERGIWWTGLGISLEQLSRSSEAFQAYRRARGSSGMAPQLLSFVDGRLEVLRVKQ